MKEEIEAAADFLVGLVDKAQADVNSITKHQLEKFRQRLIELFHDKYQNHWFPDRPSRGQAYRCIRLNEGTKPDSMIEQAARHCGLKYSELHLPVEFTLWVDPKEVSCRFGEHDGSYCTVATFENANNEKLDCIQYTAKLSVSGSNHNGLKSARQSSGENKSPRRSGSNRSSPGINVTAAAYKPTSPPCFSASPKTWYQPNSPPPVPFTYQPMNRSSRYLVPVRLAYVRPRYPWVNFPVNQLVTA